MRVIPKVLLPAIVGVTVYLIVEKLFPEKVKNFEKDPFTYVRGGANQIKLFRRILNALMNDKGLKIKLDF